MRKKQPRSRAAASVEGSPNGSPPENLQQVRDILFGAEMRDLESRQAAMETRLRQETAELRDALEKQIGAQGEELTERWSAARKETAETLRGIEKEFKQANRRLEQQLDKVREQVEEIAAALEQRAATKVDTSALSTILAEMAERLDRKSQSPKPD